MLADADKGGRAPADRGPRRDRRAGRRPRGAFAEPVTGQRVPGSSGVVVPGRREGDDLCPAVVLFGAGPARRPPGCKVALGADWIDVRHDGGSGRPAHPITAQGQREPGVGPPLPGGPRAHRPGALAGATALVSARADRRVHRWAPTVLGHRTPQGRDRNGTKALIGVLLLHRTLPTEACSPGSTQRWVVVLPQVRDRSHPSGCGGPWRKFRYTLANFVSPDMPPGQPARADLWTNTPPG